MAKSILLKNGIIVNPLNPRACAGDLRIGNELIEEVALSVQPKDSDEVFDVSGKLVMPGLVDIHVHISSCPYGHFMLARAGVTTALDVSGSPEDIIDGFSKCGTGLTIGFLYPLIPGRTVSGPSPSVSELEKTFDYALKNGAIGVKILGGHYPLTSESTRNAIGLANSRKCWVAVHAGTVETPGDIRGLEELIRLAENRSVHIAHVNSYCRGSMANSPLDEAKRAIDALKTAPSCRSESYLALINGTSGRMEKGVPKSEVTKRSLIHGGYTADLEGMEKAIREGWAKVHFQDPERREVVFLKTSEAFSFYMDKSTDVRLSFPVNSPVSAIPIALAKDWKGNFIVNALATDGGEIPRNVTIQQGLCLVKFGAMTLSELAYKACLAPARMLGFHDRGYLEAGAIADVIVVNPDTFSVELVIAAGRIIVRNGNTCGNGGRFITMREGEKFFKDKSIRCSVNEPEWLSPDAKTEAVQ